MSRVSLLYFILCLTVAPDLRGQELLSADKVLEQSAVVTNLQLLVAGVNVDADVGIDVYRVTYSATGSNGQQDIASGLVILPQTKDLAKPILIYQHGTTDGRDDVPSNLGGGYQIGAIFAAKNMIVLAPDYIGMGTSEGFHPYVHAETEATAAVDLLEAVQPFLREQGIDWNDQLFTAGYSQGGHAAMALHKYVQEQLAGFYEMTASLPMSGPYSISGIMRDLVFAEEVYTSPSFLIYTMLGIKQLEPELIGDISQYFKEPYLPYIREFEASGNGLGTLNENLISTLIQIHGASIPRYMFKDSIIQVFETDDDHPFNRALRENDLYQWTPKAPVLMPYCPADDQVPYTNSILTDSTMNALGAADVMAVDVSGGEPFDHGDCAVPALNVGIPWILNFVNFTTSTGDVTDIPALSIYPNPVQDRLYIKSPTDIELIQIYTTTGQLIATKRGFRDRTHIDLSDVHPGIYHLRLVGEDGVSSRTIVK